MLLHVAVGTVVGRARVIRDISHKYKSSRHDDIDPTTWSTVYLVVRNMGEYFVIYSPPIESYSADNTTVFWSNEDGELLNDPTPLRFGSPRRALYWLGIGCDDPNEQDYEHALPKTPHSFNEPYSNYNYPLIQKLAEIPNLHVMKDSRSTMTTRNLEISIDDRSTDKQPQYPWWTTNCDVYYFKISIRGHSVSICSKTKRQDPISFSFPNTIASEVLQMLQVLTEYASTGKYENDFDYFSTISKPSRKF